MSVGDDDATEDDGEVLSADLLSGQWPAGLIPAHRHPGGVTDEPVHQIDVDVGLKVALGYSLVDDVHPHFSLALVEFIYIAESRLRRESLRLVLIDDDLGMMMLDRFEGSNEQTREPGKRVRLGIDDVLVALEEPVQKTSKHLVDHLLLG